MNSQTSQENGWVCPAICLGIATLGGVLMVVMLMRLGGFDATSAVFLGLVAAAVVAFGLIKFMCGALEPLGEGQSAVAAPSPSAPTPSAPTPTAPAPTAPEAGAPSAAVTESAPPAGSATSAPAAAAASAATVGAGTTLAGEEELASRKGTWTYGGPSADDTAGDQGDADYEGEGVEEGENEGTRPAALEAPRDGQADNLKEIKGVGPKLEKMLNDMGFYHFDQIANWTPDEVAWVNANLEGFKGRASRDGWIAQAKILAEGGETEFSKRVDEGDVY